ncbi:MAG: TolC family protein [Gemmatimonadota bacterium]
MIPDIFQSSRRTSGGPWRPTALASVAAFALLLPGPRPLAAQADANARGASSAQPLVLPLAEAIKRARDASEGIALARAGTVRARGQQYQARSVLMPQLSTSLNYQKTLQNQFQAISNSTNSGNNGGGGDTTLAENPLTRIFASPYTTTFGLTASQNLFTGGAATANIRAAQAGRESADIAVSSSEAQAVLDVTQAYYDALLADELVTIAESSLVQSERAFRQVQLTNNVGTASEFELIRARVTRDNQRPGWLQSRTGRDLAYVRLRQLLDLPADQPLSLTDRPVGSPVVARADTAAQITTVNVEPREVLTLDPTIAARTRATVSASDTSSATRAPVRQAIKGVEIARQQLRATRAQRYPTIGISTNYQRLAYPSDGLPLRFSEFFPNWTAAIGVSFPFFTGGRVRGQELAAEAAVQEAEQRLRLTQEGASLDARQAVAFLEEAEAAWAASVGTEEQATRAYSIAEVRFREGISTQLELSETRVQLQQALANRARAARDLSVARVRVQLLPNLPLGTGGAQSSTTNSTTPSGTPPTGNTP